ncbi:MAG: hypothetical protein V1779_10055 [bacterium]
MKAIKLKYADYVTGIFCISITIILFTTIFEICTFHVIASQGPILSSHNSNLMNSDENEFKVFSYMDERSDTLLLAGEAEHISVSSASTGRQFTITSTTLYSVALYLEENGAQKIFENFNNQDPNTVLKGSTIHRSIIDASFPKALIIKFSSSQTARTIRNDIMESLGKIIRTDALEVLSFLNCVSYVKKEYKPNDEIIILILDNKKILVTNSGQYLPVIESSPLVRAILSLWIGVDKLSGQKSGLLSKFLK